jgi:starch synthase
VCKSELQKRFLLDIDPAIPIVGVVSRFADQKGLDLLASSIEAIVNTMKVQVVVLGSGDKGLEAFYGGLPARYPGHIGSHIGYSNELAHWIEAGSDFFIMPSRYEPCGLNQLYSLRYGTIPIVRATGGLADTVKPYRGGKGTGFVFEAYTGAAMLAAIDESLATYAKPKAWSALVGRAMAQDFSWSAAAVMYENLYRATQSKAKRSLAAVAG